MPKKWIEIYMWHRDGFHEKEKGTRPSCFPFFGTWPGEKRIIVPSRPNNIFAICADKCRKHLYWYCWEDDVCGGEFPSQELVEIYEKQSGRLTEIDEYIAVEEIGDERMADFMELLNKCEEALKKRRPE